MKHEAEQELLKTLNGQLNELPSITKTMIQQYQLSAIILSIMCGVILIISLISTIWLSIFFFKKGESRSTKEKMYGTDYTVVSYMIAGLGGTFRVLMGIPLTLNIIHACAPIASLVQYLLN